MLKNIKNMNQPLISIIIPVYNVEKYLDRCVNSVIKQTYSNLEIILIDDGSSDSSGILCDELAIKDSRIKVTHKKNGGVSSARNCGMEIATGEYIAFVDSDDWIASDMYEYCMNLMNLYSADVVEINYKAVSDEYHMVDNQDEIVHFYKSERILEHFMIVTTISSGGYSVWRCLFKKKSLSSIRFRDGKINEDIDYKYMALANCKTMIVSNKIKYFYYQSGNSLSLGGLQRKDYDLYDAAEELYKLTIRNESALVRKLGEVKRARTDFSLLCKIAFYGIADSSIDRKSTVRQLTRNLRRNLMILLDSPIPLSRKLMVVVLCIHIKLLEFPLKVYKKLK